MQINPIEKNRIINQLIYKHSNKILLFILGRKRYMKLFNIQIIEKIAKFGVKINNKIHWYEYNCWSGCYWYNKP